MDEMNNMSLTQKKGEEKNSLDTMNQEKTSTEPEQLPLQCPHANIEKGRVTCSLLNVKIPQKQSNACQSVLYRLCLIYIQFDKKIPLSSRKAMKKSSNASCQHLITVMKNDQVEYKCNIRNQPLNHLMALQFCKKSHHVECFLLKR